MIEVISFASGSKGNAYLIDDGHTKILLDCGITWKEIQIKTNFQTADIGACLITHSHSDHCKAINEVAKAGIDIFISEEEKQMIGINHHRIKSIESLKQFKLGTWVILPFDVNHDTDNPLGFLLVNQKGEKLLFATDTYYLRYKFKGLTHILIEANYSMKILEENIASGSVPEMMKKRLIKSHFSLENVIEFLKANDLSKVQEIWLLHLSDKNADEELFKREVMELTGKLVIIP